ncbi:hypothetical protein BXO88_10810 [Oribacterium sp. C9]|uniref:helix-turn-helix domain-containing protein n=1 Tax=Oribacterium sp. C9 TaxID=1943579 RepID=UPI00098FD544|nr:helix-turn-helix transcriptional regulator [Oribacterium sp. C9]OON85742.1 hypothetical protein BXO88_10810 [Oribacterium sp. C9]
MVVNGFAANLKKLRKSKNETQQQLANALGVSRCTVSKWENKYLEADYANLIAIAEHYRITIDQLLR